MKKYLSMIYSFNVKLLMRKDLPYYCNHVISLRFVLFASTLSLDFSPCLGAYHFSEEKKCTCNHCFHSNSFPGIACYSIFLRCIAECGLSRSNGQANNVKI